MSRGPVRQHSWHNSRSLLVVAIVVWCLVAAMALVIGWFMPALIAHTTSSTIGDATYYDTEASGAAARFAAGLAIAVLPVGVIGILAQAFYGARTTAARPGASRTTSGCRSPGSASGRRCATRPTAGPRRS